MKVGITGASSSIGREIVLELLKSNHEITVFGRSTFKNQELRHFDLGDNEHDNFIGDLDCIIHCAWDLSDLRNPDININTLGTKKLLNQMNEKAHFIFISSLSAFNPESRYGHLKYLCEQSVLSRKGTVIRCGIIWGRNETGILLKLQQLSRLPIFCVHLKPDSVLFQSNVHDVVRVVIDDIYRRRNRIVIGAYPEPFQLSELMHALRKKLIHLSISISKIENFLRGFQKFGFFRGIRVDSLKGDLREHTVQISKLAKFEEILFSDNEVFMLKVGE